MFNFMKKSKKNEILSPCNGHFVKLENIPDEVFSKGLIGEGFAINPTNNNVYSPISGTVKMVFETKHAICIETSTGAEFIVHIGLDTVNLKGDGFKTFVNPEQKISAGDLIVSADFEKIKLAGYHTDVIVVCTNSHKITLNCTNTILEEKELLGNY